MVERGGGDDGSGGVVVVRGMVMVVELWWAAVGRQPEERAARGGECYTCIGEKKGKAKDEYYGKLILNLGNEVRSSVEQGTTAMEKLVEKLGNAEDKAECKKLKKQDFEERHNEAIDVPIEDEKSPSSEPRGSPHDA
ncbi:hypothetical protein Tco_0018620 [Tanacetum coccineum]